MLSSLSRRAAPCFFSPQTRARSFTRSALQRSFALYDVDDEQNLTILPKMPSPGLMCVVSKPLDASDAGVEKYSRFYDKEHIPDVLATGCTKIALRYKNINKDSSDAFLALYTVEDSAVMQSSETSKLVEETRKSPTYGGEDIYDHISFELRPYEKIQAFEGYGHADKDGKDRSPTVVCVSIEPGSGEGAEDDFEAWYRRQHLDMLSMCRGYRRTTRYKRMDGKKPRYLAMHEYDCKPDELPSDQIKQTTSTEWAEKILGEAKGFERNVFELVQVQGDDSVKL